MNIFLMCTNLAIKTIYLLIKCMHIDSDNKETVLKKSDIQQIILQSSILSRVLFFFLGKKMSGTSLVVQWLRICLPMQGTQVRSLVREDPTCHGAAKPVRHNY